MTLSHLESVKYDVKCKCLRCNGVYTKRVSERFYLDLIKGDRQDPPCPKKKCRDAIAAAEIKRQAENMANVLASQRAPGSFSNGTRAIDMTNRIVAADYGLTDLRNDDRVRADESSAPKLPPAQQALADNFFGGGKIATNPMMQARMANAAAMAGSGALAPARGEHIIDHIMAKKYKPPYKVIASG